MATTRRFGKTYWGASALISLDQTDTRSGEKRGPALWHVCVTNSLHIVNLMPYQRLAA